jgi:hypothetical protein
VTSQQPRTLPIRVAPVPEEALDSWFDALAHRLHIPVVELLPALGLLGGTRRYANRRLDVPADRAILLRPAEIDTIAAASGETHAVIEAMTVARYDQRAVVIDRASRRVNIRTLWGRGQGSRYCPDCLAATAGRWQLGWRLSWTFACLLHRRLLADWCPQCGRTNEYSPAPRTSPHGPGTAPTRSTPSTAVRCEGRAVGMCAATPISPRRRRCSYPTAIPSCTPQYLLAELFESGKADFGVYAADPQPAIAALADIRSIAGRAVAYAATADMTAVLPTDPVTAQLYLLAQQENQRSAARGQVRPGTMASPNAPTTALASTIAFNVLLRPDVQSAAATLAWLTTTRRGTRAQLTHPSTVGDWGRTTTGVLRSVQLAAMSSRLRPNDQLRYRTASPRPRQPDVDPAMATARLHKIPTLFWPLWTARISPPQGLEVKILRPALSSAVLLVGTRLGLADTAAQLGSATSRYDISKTLQLLQSTRQWPDIAAALNRLMDYLDTHDIPIDYQRRRQLDYRQLLPSSEWQRLCRDAGTSWGSDVRARAARCVLFEQLSGMPSNFAPFDTGTAVRNLGGAMNQFAAVVTPDLARGLQESAADFLARHGIPDEPATWQPPLRLLDGFDLPGVDPDQIDLQRLHQLIRTDQVSTGTAAKRLGTTDLAVHIRLQGQPAPPRPRAQRPTRQPGREVLPREVLAQLYLDEHLSLAQIDKRAGFAQGCAARLAHDYGIPIRGGKDHTHPTLTRDWIFEQHITCGRSLHDLAREKQMSPSAINRWAHLYDIPIQRRPIRMNIPAAIAATPALLRPAITGPNAWNRLHRFAEASRHATFTLAATALGIHPSTLIQQTQRLEREFGQPLLEREQHRDRRIMRPTAFGQTIIAAVQARGEHRNEKSR